MNFCEYRLAASGSAVPGVAIVYRSQVSPPGVAASFRRPGAKLAADQGNLAGVITVMRRKLPQHGMHRGLARRLWRADVLNSSLHLGRIGFRELGKPREQIGEAASCCPPRLSVIARATLGRIRMRRPAFDRFV